MKHNYLAVFSCCITCAWFLLQQLPAWFAFAFGLLRNCSCSLPYTSSTFCITTRPWGPRCHFAININIFVQLKLFADNVYHCNCLVLERNVCVSVSLKFKLTLRKNWSFSLKIPSVNVTKSAGNFLWSVNQCSKLCSLYWDVSRILSNIYDLGFLENKEWIL